MALLPWNPLHILICCHGIHCTHWSAAMESTAHIDLLPWNPLHTLICCHGMHGTHWSTAMKSTANIDLLPWNPLHALIYYHGIYCTYWSTAMGCTAHIDLVSWNPLHILIYCHWIHCTHWTTAMGCTAHIDLLSWNPLHILIYCHGIHCTHWSTAIESTAHIDLLSWNPLHTLIYCQLLAELVLVGTDDTAYCLSVQFPIAYLKRNLYGPSYKKVNPNEAHSYYATVGGTAENTLDSTEGGSFPLNGRPTSERGKLIPLDSYSCSKVTTVASAEWPRKWQFTLSVKLLSCAIRILERTDGKGNRDSFASPFITYLWLVFLRLIRSDFDGKHFWRVFTVTVLSFQLYSFRVHNGELQPSDGIPQWWVCCRLSDRGQ